MVQFHYEKINYICLLVKISVEAGRNIGFLQCGFCTLIYNLVFVRFKIPDLWRLRFIMKTKLYLLTNQNLGRGREKYRLQCGLYTLNYNLDTRSITIGESQIKLLNIQLYRSENNWMDFAGFISNCPIKWFHIVI